MNKALSYYIKNIGREQTEELLINSKKEASFSGSIRKNLIEMLDEIKLNQLFNIDSCIQLFGDHNHIVHLTSLLRYPTFVKGNNYTGSSPKILTNELLKSVIMDIFVPEMELLNDDVIIIPMGKAVKDVLEYLIKENIIAKRNILLNFPHPSGANGHRIKIFKENKERFIELLVKLK